MKRFIERFIENTINTLFIPFVYFLILGVPTIIVYFTNNLWWFLLILIITSLVLTILDYVGDM